MSLYSFAQAQKETPHSYEESIVHGPADKSIHWKLKGK
jgi:hypothetical protein